MDDLLIYETGIYSNGEMPLKLCQGPLALLTEISSSPKAPATTNTTTTPYLHQTTTTYTTTTTPNPYPH